MRVQHTPLKAALKPFILQTPFDPAFRSDSPSNLTVRPAATVLAEH